MHEEVETDSTKTWRETEEREREQRKKSIEREGGTEGGRDSMLKMPRRSCSCLIQHISICAPIDQYVRQQVRKFC